jgi:hypothetical protein
MVHQVVAATVSTRVDEDAIAPALDRFVGQHLKRLFARPRPVQGRSVVSASKMSTMLMICASSGTSPLRRPSG